MSPLLVALCYGSAIVISLFLLWYFGSFSWLLHAAAVALALLIGLIPMTERWNAPVYTLATGWVFLLLLTWGAVGVVLRAIHFDKPYRTHHLHH